MLVLINREVFDVGEPVETLAAMGVELREAPRLAHILKLGQDAAFQAGGFERAHQGIRRTLAAFLALSGEANCALFLAPPHARSAREVAVRFALAPLTNLGYLLSLQQSGRLSPQAVNEQVWVAGGHAAA